MRRDFRKNNTNNDLNEKIIKYTTIGVAILAVIVLGLLIYSKSLNDKVKDETLSSEQISSILNNVSSSGNTQSASTEIGKSVNEAKNEMQNETKNEVKNNTTNTQTNNASNVLNTNTVNSTNVSKSNQTTNTANTNTSNENTEKSSTEKTVDLQFALPVEGDIVRDFAVDSLIYSETLQEWTTHTGVDIKADKTTVVKAAEAGTVKTIKNDPRYGMTVVIEHANGFKTSYSNLLTSEFVVEGEKVEKGQSIGTVGNTAAFEIADEPHLHFEILKDNVAVDPNIYLK